MKRDKNMDRVKNTIRNQLSVAILVVLSIIVPFVFRTLLTNKLGEQYVGLNSVYISLIGVINLTELGIAPVMTFFLYEPIVIKDYVKINAYLHYLKRFYQMVGVIGFGVGLVILPFLKVIVNQEIPKECNIYLLYFIFLVSNEIRCFVLPELVILVNAFQRTDIDNWININGNIMGYILQLIALVLFESYVLYVFAVLLQSIFILIFRWRAKKKYFDDFQADGMINTFEKEKIINKLKVMIGHQLDEKLIGTIDTIFLSSYLGLVAVAIYGNYFLIVTAVTMFIFSIIKAALPSIGNAIVVETIESNYFRYKCIFQLSAFIVGWASSCLLCLCQDFMKLWMGKPQLGMGMVILFCIYFYLSGMRQSTLLFKNAAGMWENDKWKPYVAIGVNILLDLIFIPLMGMKAAIISSIISIGIVELPWEAKVLYRDYFNLSFLNYIKLFLKYFISNSLVIIGNLMISKYIQIENLLFLMICKVACCTVWTILIAYLCFRKSKEMKEIFIIINRFKNRV